MMEELNRRNREADERMSPEELALATVADRRRHAAAAEAMTGQRGAISEALRAIGTEVGPLTVEAAFEMFFWDGVRSGLRASHSPEVRESLIARALNSPGLDDR